MKYREKLMDKTDKSGIDFWALTKISLSANIGGPCNIIPALSEMLENTYLSWVSGGWGGWVHIVFDVDHISISINIL